MSEIDEEKYGAVEPGESFSADGKTNLEVGTNNLGNASGAKIRKIQMETIGTTGLADYWGIKKGNAGNADARNAIVANLKEKFEDSDKSQGGMHQR